MFRSSLVQHEEKEKAAPSFECSATLSGMGLHWLIIHMHVHIPDTLHLNAMCLHCLLHNHHNKIKSVSIPTLRAIFWRMEILQIQICWAHRCHCWTVQVFFYPVLMIRPTMILVYPRTVVELFCFCFLNLTSLKRHVSQNKKQKWNSAGSEALSQITKCWEALKAMLDHWPASAGASSALGSPSTY